MADAETDVTVLEREMYEVGEAARLLGLHTRTLRNWLDGYSAKGRAYRPVLREQATGSDTLTWGEFVEAGFLTEYRKVQKIRLPEIRQYIDTWRERLGVRYPLAHQQPYSGPGPHLLDVADDAEGDTFLYRFADGQLTFTPWAEQFVRKVEFENSVAQRFWPDGQEQPVVIDPTRSFGAPTVESVRTEVLFEMFAAGDQIGHIADGYDLPPPVVEAAIRYESSRGRGAVAA